MSVWQQLVTASAQYNTKKAHIEKDWDFFAQSLSSHVNFVSSTPPGTLKFYLPHDVLPRLNLVSQDPVTK